MGNGIVKNKWALNKENNVIFLTHLQRGQEPKADKSIQCNRLWWMSKTWTLRKHLKAKRITMPQLLFCYTFSYSLIKTTACV